MEPDQSPSEVRSFMSWMDEDDEQFISIIQISCQKPTSQGIQYAEARSGRYYKRST